MVTAQLRPFRKLVLGAGPVELLANLEKVGLDLAVLCCGSRCFGREIAQKSPKLRAGEHISFRQGSNRQSSTHELVDGSRADGIDHANGQLQGKDGDN